MAYTVVIVIHIMVSIFLVTTILFQTGKGASMGASFGGGTQAVFGGSGPASFLMKITVACAVIFMLTSLYLTYVSGRAGAHSLMKNATPVIKTVPAPEDGIKPEAKATTEATKTEAKTATEKKTAKKAKREKAKATKAKPAPVTATPAPAN
ncbi:Protein translocase membrane subunit SecG [hydrothermal vent metagenome]|uniref:Protein translocase membrane subunit SecG n=1 Tax=hydrothermal vent metagenome TaxID=652676 RepID=A0A3B0QZK7_9ZZZZ